MPRPRTDTIHFLPLAERDRQVLTPLIWEHVNPYGRQELDIRTRSAALA